MTEFEGTQAGPDKILVTVIFEPAFPVAEAAFEKVVRNWYHVPRIGESVDLRTEGQPSIMGHVRYVDWYDDYGAVGLE